MLPPSSVSGLGRGLLDLEGVAKDDDCASNRTGEDAIVSAVDDDDDDKSTFFLATVC